MIEDGSDFADDAPAAPTAPKPSTPQSRIDPAADDFVLPDELPERIGDSAEPNHPAASTSAHLHRQDIGSRRMPELAPADDFSEEGDELLLPDARRTPTLILVTTTVAVIIAVLVALAYFFVMKPRAEQNRLLIDPDAPARVEARPVDPAALARAAPKSADGLPSATAAIDPIDPDAVIPEPSGPSASADAAPDPAVAALVQSLTVGMVRDSGGRFQVMINNVGYGIGSIIDPASGLMLLAVDPDNRELLLEDTRGAHYTLGY